MAGHKKTKKNIQLKDVRWHVMFDTVAKIKDGIYLYKEPDDTCATKNLKYLTK